MARTKVKHALLMFANGNVAQYPVCMDEDGDWPEELDFEEGELEDSEDPVLLFEKIDLPYSRSGPVYQQVFIDPREEVPPPATREEVILQVETVLRQDRELLGYWKAFLDWGSMRSQDGEVDEEVTQPLTAEERRRFIEALTVDEGDQEG